MGIIIKTIYLQVVKRSLKNFFGVAFWSGRAKKGARVKKNALTTIHLV